MSDAKHIIRKISSVIDVREGSLIDAQIDWFTRLIQNHLRIERIAETGFNAGFSAITFLAARNYITVTSFDWLIHPYALTAKRLIDRRFPYRHTLIAGSTENSIRAMKNCLYDYSKLFDLVFIDGGHGGNIPLNDSLHLLSLLTPKGFFVMDDYDEPDSPVKRAWDKLILQGYIVPFDCVHRPERTWIAGLRTDTPISPEMFT